MDYAKAFDCVDQKKKKKQKLCKILKGMGIPDHLTCHLRNLHTGQEATVRTGYAKKKKKKKNWIWKNRLAPN